MRTILIIDDDIAIGNMEQEVLERAGYATRRAYSGTEALLVLKTMRPDLILLDLMPAFRGRRYQAIYWMNFRALPRITALLIPAAW